MQMRSTAREPAAEVGDQSALHRHDPQEVGRGRPFTAAHTGAHGARESRRTTGRGRVYRVVHPSAPSAAPGTPRGSSPDPGPVSGRMSIRQPVRRAASRAFWPSRPIASESW